MIGFIIRSIGMYKDGKGVLDNPAEGAGDIAYDFVKPLMALGTIVTWILSIVGFLGGYALGDATVFKVIFWVGLVLFIIVRVMGWIMRTVFRATAGVFTNTTEDIIVKVKEIQKEP